MKKITICGSMQFFAQIEQLREKLSAMGYMVFTPILEGTGVDYTLLSPQEQVEKKNHFINAHIEKIRESDGVIIANYDKGEMQNYIGANTFLEMAFAYILQKKIFILQDIPEQPNRVEIAGLLPIVLGGDLRGLDKAQ